MPLSSSTVDRRIPEALSTSRGKPAGVSDGNWIQTMPGKGWNTILRLYSPLESFFDKSWRPSEIELVKRVVRSSQRQLLGILGVLTTHNWPFATDGHSLDAVGNGVPPIPFVIPQRHQTRGDSS